MKRTLIIILALIAFVFSGCITDGETSSNFTNPETSNAEKDAPEKDESFENLLATEQWEKTTTENGNDVLRKYTKEYNGDENNYILTVMEYTNGEHTGKKITVITEGNRTHDETYEYNGDTLIYSCKNDYTPSRADPSCSYIFCINEYDSEYAYYESEMHYSEDGAVTQGLQTKYNEDGTIYSTEEISQKELDGYICRYSVITNYENSVAIGITHLAYDRNMNYFYTEKRTAEDVVLYAKKSVSGIDLYTFPGVGGVSISGTECEFFDANGNTVAKGHMENNIITLYEITGNLSEQDAVGIVDNILKKAQEFGI